MGKGWAENLWQECKIQGGKELEAISGDVCLVGGSRSRGHFKREKVAGRVEQRKLGGLHLAASFGKHTIDFMRLVCLLFASFTFWFWSMYVPFPSLTSSSPMEFA